MHKIIRNILRFIIRHNKLCNIFTKRKWFNDLLYEEAQRVLDNR